MKIYYFAHTFNAPSTRYRGVYLLKELKTRFNIEFDILYPNLKSFFKAFFIILRNSIKKDTENIYIFQKISAKGKYFNLIKILLKTVEKSIYDLDDAMYEIRDKQVVDFLIKNCNSVIVASENLKNYCRIINPRTYLFTTPLPAPEVVKKNKNEKLTIGWIGIYTTVHIESLNKIFFPILEKINFGIKLAIVGVYRDTDEANLRNYFKKIKNVELQIIRDIDWEKEEEINNQLINFDIGIAPMIDNEINRSKSAFKIKQYLACGVPVLASDVGDNKLFIKNEENGFLCHDKNDWIKYINYFYNLDADNYLKFIKKSRESFLEGDFNLGKTADKFYLFIKKIQN